MKTQLVRNIETTNKDFYKQLKRALWCEYKSRDNVVKKRFKDYGGTRDACLDSMCKGHSARESIDLFL